MARASSSSGPTSMWRGAATGSSATRKRSSTSCEAPAAARRTNTDGSNPSETTAKGGSMSTPAPSTGDVLDVTGLIDRGGLGGFQIRIVALCSLVAMLDGADSASIAIAATTIAGKLNFPMSAFGVVFSAATLGAMVGAMTFGPLADRFGRKRFRLGAAALFGVFPAATAYADSYSSLIVCRILAGLGLGGATPCFLALVSEYMPKRMRGTMVSV